MAFTAEEIATIRKFTDWIKEGKWLDGYSEGITGSNDEGITVTEFDCESDYDGGWSRCSTDTFIPWIALTNPVEYERQCEEQKRERERQAEVQRLEWQARREADELALLAALKAKYEKERNQNPL
jgi:hypothetical protein